MPDMHIEIKNLPQIKRAFGMAPKLMTTTINNTIKKTIYTVSRDSRLNTPVDTGTLRRSTYERFSPLYGEVGTRTNYDMYVHEGTRYMTARPYLRRAVEKNASNIAKDFTDAVQGVLDTIGKAT